MRKLWFFIDKKNWNRRSKYGFAVLLLETLSAAAGIAVWLIVRTWILSAWYWLPCFTGYALVLSFFAVFFYACNHDFHDGAVSEDCC